MKERLFAESAALGAEFIRVDVELNDVFEADRGGRAAAPDWRGHWEILNEPDGDWAFEGSPEDYARTLIAAHAAIKARAPEDRIVLGGIMRPEEPAWLERVLAVPGATGAFDIANVNLRGSLDGVVRRHLEVRGRLARHGVTGPLWVTEPATPPIPPSRAIPHTASARLPRRAT
jgi:hypothetical protein